MRSGFESLCRAANSLRKMLSRYIPWRLRYWGTIRKHIFGAASPGLSLRDWRGALDDLGAAIRLKPGQARYYQVRVEVSQHLEHHDLLVEDLERLLRSTPMTRAYSMALRGSAPRVRTGSATPAGHSLTRRRLSASNPATLST